MVSLAKPQIIVHAFVLSCLDYCNALFTDSDKSSFGGLKQAQNAAARLLSHSSKGALHIIAILFVNYYLIFIYYFILFLYQ